MKTLIGIGLGVVALLGVASLTERDECADLGRGEWGRRFGWPDAPVPMDEEEQESHWYEWAA